MLRQGLQSTTKISQNMLQWTYARVVKLVDTHALGACAARLAGPSPVAGTNDRQNIIYILYYINSRL